MGQSWESWQGIEDFECEVVAAATHEETAARQLRAWAETLPRRQEASDGEIAVDAIRSRVNQKSV